MASVCTTAPMTSECLDSCSSSVGPGGEEVEAREGGGEGEGRAAPILVGETGKVEIEQAGGPAGWLEGEPARKETDGQKYGGIGEGRAWPEQRERQQPASGAWTLPSCSAPWWSGSRGRVGEEPGDHKENEAGLYGGGEEGGVGERKVRGGFEENQSRGGGGRERAGGASS